MVAPTSACSSENPGKKMNCKEVMRRDKNMVRCNGMAMLAAATGHSDMGLALTIRGPLLVPLPKFTGCQEFLDWYEEYSDIYSILQGRAYRCPLHCWGICAGEFHQVVV